MPAPANTRTTSRRPPSTAGAPDGRRGQLGRGWRLRSEAASPGRPDAAVLAREAVIGFLNDASKATADRAAGIPAAAPEPGTRTGTGDGVSVAGQGTAAQATGSAGWGAAA